MSSPQTANNLAAASDSSYGDTAWVPYGDEAAIFALDSGETSYYFVAKNFGFSIPTGATIIGIAGLVTESITGNVISTSRIRIVKGGVIGATELLQGPGWESGFDLLGGTTDLCGETWTAADINDPDFGVAISCTSENPSGEGLLSGVQLWIYYNEANPLPCGGVPPTKQFGAFGDLLSMKKNTSGQKIGCQMLTIADGTPFTGSVTVYVTGDAGTQAAGSVGSGACTHEGNGYHTYAPAQAETNYDLIGFTFVGTGAYNQTVQVATQPAADISSDVAAIKAKTDNLPSDPADASDIASSFSTVNSKLDAIDDYIDTEMAAVKAVTDKLDTAVESDGGVYRFTTNALEQAPTGGGTPPTASEIADEVATRTLDANLVEIDGEADRVEGFGRATDAITTATVGTGSTNALIVTSSIDPPAVALNQFRGQVACFSKDTTTVNLRGHKAKINTSGSDGQLEVSPAMPDVPVSGDTFTIQ